MKVNLKELRKIVSETILEAKKSKKKIENPSDSKEHPKGFKTADNVDFSEPLDDRNYLKQQGAANFGPYTSTSKSLKDEVNQDNPLKEAIDSMVFEEICKDPWGFLGEMLEKKSNIQAETIWENIDVNLLDEKKMAEKSAVGRKKK
jgi:hypothetical protein